MPFVPMDKLGKTLQCKPLTRGPTRDIHLNGTTSSIPRDDDDSHTIDMDDECSEVVPRASPDPLPGESREDSLIIFDDDPEYENDPAHNDVSPEEAQKYLLRPQTRQVAGGFTTTWIDQDQTGDYDPSEEQRQERLRRQRARLRGKDCASSFRRCLDDTEGKDEAGPKESLQWMITCRFPGEAGRAKFAHVVANLPAIHPACDKSLTGRDLRKRKRVFEFAYNDAGDYKKVCAELNLPSDPTGHPFARGCLGCLTLGHECSLLHDEASWPCEECWRERHDCILVTPPVRKRACERCKGKRSACSYSYTLNHGDACQQCRNAGYCCVAGPAKDTIRTRLRYPEEEGAKPVPVKKTTLKVRNYLPCVECTESGRRCNFQDAGNIGQACQGCKENGEPCTIESLAPQQRNQARASDPPNEAQALGVPEVKEGSACADETPSPQQEARSESTSDISKYIQGARKTIETRFCHPIAFNHQDDAAGTQPCHFCTEPSYAIFGLERRRVTVVEGQDGSGMQEVSGGHKGDGVENTRMCPCCTLSRLSIIMCSEHEFRRLSGGASSRAAGGKSTAWMELLSGGVQADRQWCSVCPSPAAYSCCKHGESGQQGCGLKLCGRCRVALACAFDGDLQKMLGGLKDESTEEKMLGLRADWDLLKQDGLLMRFLLAAV